MKKMTDKKTILLVVMLLTVITTSMIIGALINAMESEAVAHKELEVFKQAMTIVSKNYVEDVESKELIHGAVKGMLGSLDTNYDSIRPEKYKELETDINSMFTGIKEAEVDNTAELKLFKETLAIVRKNYEEDVQPKDLIYGAIKGMIGSLDSHSDFMTPEQYKEMQTDAMGEFGGIGIKLDIIEGVPTVIRLLEDTPAFRAGIKEGDKIIKINNAFTKKMSLQDAVNKMRGIPSTKVKLTINRKGWRKTRDFTIMRETIKVDSISSKMLGNGIGYIKIYQFQKQTASDLSAALSGLKKNNINSLILDLRDNPGGLFYSAVDVVSQFIPSGRLVVYTKDKNGKKKEYLSRQNGHYLTVPMVVIVNEGSASASEILTGALKDWNRATVIGTKTYGKGSVQTVVPLKDGSAVRLTTAKYFTPKGVSIQTTGITPDIMVKPNLKKAYIYGIEKYLEGYPIKNDTNERAESSEKIVLMINDGEEDIQLQSAIHLLKTKILRLYNSTCYENSESCKGS